ncbi:winged helix-turn-helix domain-containing protein [Nocardiopsis dassonvillei]|uniref:winged helix-turn-helix domain-containing protein n=1 Tax=Nocardiopsis dassonvillei TaxID=2014 RepID=UPI00366FA44E
MTLRKKRTAPEQTDVVAALRKQVQDAKALQSVPDQDLLSDPRLNPATRGQADTLSAERLKTRLELEHRRVLRSERETDRRAEEAIRAAQAVDAARAATDPAYMVLDLTRSRRHFAHLSLAASIVLSIGSAMGLEAAVHTHQPEAPTGIGYLAEVALTGMSTAAIIWAGKLAFAGALPKGRVRTALVALVVIPLLVSIIGSTIGSGPVGAVASLGSAAFSLFAYLITVTSADAITAVMARITGATAPHHAESGQNEAIPAPPRHNPGDGLAVAGEAIAEEAADYLRDHHRSHGGPSERSHEEDRSHGDSPERSHGQQDPVTVPPAPEPEQVIPSERPCERDRSHEDDESTERVLTAQERRRLEGERNRRRVADHLYRNPDAHTAEIAEALGLGESTVRRIRREIEAGGDAS